jgi:hypothetical protein
MKHETRFYGSRVPIGVVFDRLQLCAVGKDHGAQSARCIGLIMSQFPWEIEDKHGRPKELWVDKKHRSAMEHG